MVYTLDIPTQLLTLTIGRRTPGVMKECLLRAGYFISRNAHEVISKQPLLPNQTIHLDSLAAETSRTTLGQMYRAAQEQGLHLLPLEAAVQFAIELAKLQKQTRIYQEVRFRFANCLPSTNLPEKSGLAISVNVNGLVAVEAHEHDPERTVPPGVPWFFAKQPPCF